MSKNQKIISDKLLKWYDQNARLLPWRLFGRAKPDPYKIWISEIMLQQTTVQAVIPYFKLFIQKWPTVDQLCKSDLSEVLHLWSGLGYYSRARNLHLSSSIINSKYNNFLPSTESELLKLPGIGSYTAAAIMAIAFNKRAVVVDGNIKRVVSRLFFLEKPIKENYREIWDYTNCITPNIRVGDFVQSLMDLGSEVCTPSKPRCYQCPVINDCKAKNNKKENFIPLKQRKLEKNSRNGSSFFIRKGQKVLIYKRLDHGLLASLDALPSIGWDNQVDHRLEFIKKLEKKKISSIKHEFTHFTLKMDIYLVEYLENENLKLPKDFIWADINNLKKFSFPTLMQKILKKIINDQKP
ncbi:MAG: A/G-specific adenine glycosylase [SAR116 cluster bacterium]|nr:A/G-specific adenine glycosylase [SAR116 cluster bacterium]